MLVTAKTFTNPIPRSGANNPAPGTLMASTTYTQHYSDGTFQTLRRKKQGAPVKADDLKNTHTIIVHLTKQDYDQFVNAQVESGMSMSAYGRLVLHFGVVQLSDSDNC